jgi:uncharacterized protein YqjF (DUF2071 family)
MRMVWHDLLFAHWRVEAEALRPLIPPGLRVETFDGAAWLGVIPFRMSGVRPRFLPPIPTTGAFCELNVRTYVTDGEKPGVWFFSLDAPSRLAVEAARWGFHLNYRSDAMRCERQGDEGAEEDAARQNDRAAQRTDWPEGEPGWIRYESRRFSRRGRSGPVWRSDRDPGAEAVFSGRYRPIGEAFRAEPDSLEAFLTERYCLYAADRGGRIYRGDIHHEPWHLRRAEARIERNTMTAPLGVGLPAEEPHLLFADRMDVVAWPAQRVRAAPSMSSPATGDQFL